MMRDDNRGDPAPGDHALERVEMRGVVGAGVDHRNVGRTDDVGLCAGKGIGRRVRREHARDKRLELDRDAGRMLSHCREMAA
jgi:hypothetical protein